MNKIIKIFMGFLGVLVLSLGVQAKWPFKSSSKPVGPIHDPAQERLDGYDRAPKYEVALTEKFLNTQDLDMVKLLVENDAIDVNVADSDGNTALHKAAQRGDYDMVEYLITKSRANPRLKNNAGKTPKNLAQQENHDRIVFLIISLDDSRAF